jgi:uncharacterized membrane protein
MIRRYSRFAAFLITGVVIMLAAWRPFGMVPAVLIGFDAGVLVFFASLVSLFKAGTAASMRQRSQANEPDHHLLLWLALAIAAITITAVWAEILAISNDHAGDNRAMLLLATTSLALAWLFSNVLGAIHYAHLWYLRGKDGEDARGLDFPRDEAHPDYWDFVYFTTVLSMTFQVSDVTISAKPIRRLAIIHGLVAFLFNISVIALSVSAVSGVLTG